VKRKDIDDLAIYQLSMQVGESIYHLVLNWDRLDKNTIGYQLIRAADSISANISEGYGRFHFKEQRQFCYIARGSLYETNTWLIKAVNRIPNDKIIIEEIMEKNNLLLKKLNAFINYIERNIAK
jgi:four helix bundle protein